MNLTPSTAKRKLLDIFKFPCLGAMISLHVIYFCSPVSTGANTKNSLLKARLDPLRDYLSLNSMKRTLHLRVEWIEHIHSIGTPQLEPTPMSDSVL